MLPLDLPRYDHSQLADQSNQPDFQPCVCKLPFSAAPGSRPLLLRQDRKRCDSLRVKLRSSPSSSGVVPACGALLLGAGCALVPAAPSDLCSE